MTYQTVGYTLVVVLFFAIRYFNRTDTSKIQYLPELPGVPIFGNLIQLGDNHSLNAGKWAKKLGSVFQVRLGNRRIVFANTFESVRELWIHNQSALISRPVFHTYHNVASSSQSFTIGTSPWDESCKRKRKALATALNRPAVQSYMPILDLGLIESFKELLAESDYGELDIDPILYFQRFALNTSLTLGYGIRLGEGINHDDLDEVFHVERILSDIRSTSNNWQDYIPLMRLWPSRSNLATEYRDRRAKYMGSLLEMLKENIAQGTDKPCITGNVLKDPESKLNDAELNSMCLSIVSAGLDNIPSNIIMGMAYLSSPHGQEIQDRAYDEIQKIYPDGDAWSRCVEGDNVPYVVAFMKETLRFYTTIPVCLPRQSIKDIHYEKAVIPAGTTFYMNAFAADHDPNHFSSPDTFSPDRYLDTALSTSGTPHYAYGAGSRACIGAHLANRELYTAFVRLIVAFRLVPAKEENDRPVLDPKKCNRKPNGLTMDPWPFKVGLRVRDKGMLEKWIGEDIVG